MTVDKQCQSLHNFHTYAVMDRVDFCDIPNDKPIADVASLFPCQHFYQITKTAMNYDKIMLYTLLGRELIQTVPYFRLFADCIPKHIDHK